MSELGLEYKEALHAIYSVSREINAPATVHENLRQARDAIFAFIESAYARDKELVELKAKLSAEEANANVPLSLVDTSAGS